MVEDAYLSKLYRGHMHGKLIISTVNVKVQVYSPDIPKVSHEIFP